MSKAEEKSFTYNTFLPRHNVQAARHIMRLICMIQQKLYIKDNFQVYLTH